MIVVHIASSLDGGAGIGLWRYHRALVSAGVDSRILVMDPPAGHEREVSRVHWRKHPLALRIACRLGVARTRERRLKNRIAALDRTVPAASYELFTPPYSDYCPEDHPWVAAADLINLHWVAGIVDWPRFFARVRKPVVLTLHDQQPYLGGFHYGQDAANNPQLARLESAMKSVKQTALRDHRLGVVANSRWNAAEAVRSGFFPADTPVETVYYPLDADVFQPRPKDPAKAAVGIAASRLVIGFACENLANKRKGFDDLIEALGQLPENLLARTTLLSFGRDPDPAVRARVALPWVHLGFLKTDADKVAAYAAMDVFVAPSRAEAFGLTALEAGALGIPVVASRVGGLVEAVPPEDAAMSGTIRDRIVALLTDDTLRARRAEAGRRLAVERHSPAVIGPRLAAFYRKVIG
ncbi:MAG TPA: glycosyltransferase [Rariglobus sp.]